EIRDKIETKKPGRTRIGPAKEAPHEHRHRLREPRQGRPQRRPRALRGGRPLHPPPGRPRRAPRGLRPPLRGAREHRRRRPRHPGVPRRRGLRGRDPPDLVRPPHLPPPRGRPLLRLLTASARLPSPGGAPRYPLTNPRKDTPAMTTLAVFLLGFAAGGAVIGLAAAFEMGPDARDR